jgi:hypothetical protein
MPWKNLLTTPHYYGPLSVVERKDIIRHAKDCGWHGACIDNLESKDDYHRRFPFMVFEPNRRLDGFQSAAHPINKQYTRLTVLEDVYRLISENSKEVNMLGYRVDPGHQRVMDFLHNIVVEKGIDSNGPIDYNKYPLMCLRDGGKPFVFACTDTYLLIDKYELIDVPQMTKKLIGPHSVTMDFTLDNKDVVVYDNRVAVGCVTVKREQLEKMILTMNDLKRRKL